MNHPLGISRNVVKERYALFTPTGFVASSLPGWTNCVPYILIARGLGATFAQMLIVLERDGTGTGSTGDTEIFAYVMEGKCTVNKQKLSAGHFAFIPPGTDYEFSSSAKNTRLLIFQKKFETLGGTAVPKFLVGDSAQIEGQPFLGDPHARLQTLLPDTHAFDMAVNIFTFDPGAALPFVETHIMEHGLLMLDGAGVYRLDADWHPVQAGDVIWMAPYCPQWFVALGTTQSRYIYYKDVNRSPL